VVTCPIPDAATDTANLGLGETGFATSTGGSGPGAVVWTLGAPAWARFGSALGWAGVGWAGFRLSGAGFSSRGLPNFSALGAATSGFSALGAATSGFSALGAASSGFSALGAATSGFSALGAATSGFSALGASPSFGSTLDWSSGCSAIVVAGTTDVCAKAVPAPITAAASMSATTTTMFLNLTRSSLAKRDRRRV
jgi:hypothetical protein